MQDTTTPLGTTPPGTAYDSTETGSTSKKQQIKDQARSAAETTFEEVKIKGNELVDQVKMLIEEGKGKRIILRKDGRTLFELPLSIAAGGAAAAVFMAPTLAAVGAIGALVTDLSLVIEKDVADVAEGSPLITDPANTAGTAGTPGPVL
jgi:hypothetical protein